MSWIHPLAPGTEADAAVLGGKGHGLVVLLWLGLPVPPGFVIDTRACRAFLRDGRFPAGLDAELTAAARELTTAMPPPAVVGQTWSDTARAVPSGAGVPARAGAAVSVRSGAAVSMPGMMDTVLGLDLAAADGMQRLRAAVGAVFASWHTPRATTYRELHGIPHEPGTAVVVQAMVFGDRDGHSGSGVAFSRDPNTGEPGPFGDVLFGRPGEDVVSGRCTTCAVAELADREPSVWRDLVAALHRIEGHYRDACHVEFTYESGRLWLLQVRAGGLTGRAAIRVAVDLADEGLIDRRTALRRISPAQLRHARTARLRDGLDLLARGQGASPGVATGRMAVTADRAARRAAEGPVILVRPITSPLDMHGLAAATGIVTSRGGPTSHAAVVARAMGKPAVVGAIALTVDADGVRIGERAFPEGTVITIDGTGGVVVLGDPGAAPTSADPRLHRLLTWADDVSGDRTYRSDEQRLLAAHSRAD
jgi:pyruvate,orthophosphate dikinase